MYASETIQNCKNPTGHIDTLKTLFKRVGERLWRALNRMIASCFERLRSRESQPRSPSKVEDLTFKSEKVIKRAALFCSFWSLSDLPTPMLPHTELQ